LLALAALALAAPGAGAITSKQLANRVLKFDPRKPTNINLFTSVFEFGGQGIYPQGSAMHPASGPDVTQAQARSKLKSYLQEQFPGDSARVNSALALFDGQKAKSMVPDPTLRASFVGMRGTLLEPTINRLLNGGKFTPPVDYGPIPQKSFIAISAGSGPRHIIFNDRYEREDFRYLVGIMGHEVQHDDSSISRAEEVILNGLSGMTYLQVLVKHPELAYTGTELSRQMNDLAIAFLNTHEHGSPNSELYSPTGTGIFPGSPHNAPDIWTALGGDSQISPAPVTLGQITRSLGLPTASNFSLATAKTFKDLNDSWLSDVGRAQISVLLQMVSVQTIANRTGLSRSQVKSKLRLGPYLAAIK
jgi:hypothetical protein